MSTKRKPTKVAAPVVRQNAKLPVKTRIDESKTSVAARGAIGTQGIPNHETVEISSDSSENDDVSSEDEEEGEDGEGQVARNKRSSDSGRIPGKISTATGQSKQRLRSRDTSTTANTKTPTAAIDEAPASDSELQSPTFGELARSRIVDVQTQLGQQQRQSQGQHGESSVALTSGGGAPAHSQQTLAPPSLSSLGTVLTQALRSDDTELLESCLQTTDLAVVKATIQRLDSGLAASLLSRLASRMHRRPGRASTLLSWIQWTLIAHGGALASQPDLQRKLADLNRVLEERARGLNSLLVLKGKLDMLEAQMQLRRANSGGGRSHGSSSGGRSSRAAVNGDIDGGFNDEDNLDDANVVYVEGEEDGSDADAAGAGDDDPVDISAINGVDSDSDEDDSNEDLDDDGYADIGVREESLDDDDVDFDDVDESGEDDSDVDAAAPPPKVQKTSSAFPKRR